MRANLTFVAVAAAVVASSVQASPAAADHRAGGSDAVAAWNQIAVSTLVSAATPVPEQPLHLAYVHRAIYDGVLRSTQGHERVSVTAAVTASAYTVLLRNFPQSKATLDEARARSLATVRPGTSRQAGLAIGRSSAERLLRERAHDGRDGAVVPVLAPGPGTWRPIPPNLSGISSWLGSVRPFVLRTGTPLRPAEPPRMSSSRWATDYNETRLMGSMTSSSRTLQQTEVARFWADSPYVQNQRALRGYARDHHLDVVRTARLFALADTASADALIACFKTKYRAQFWRPSTAVPLGDTDGNSRTPAERTWQPLLPTPNHPEYPSAHSCATTALATVVAGLAGRSGLDLRLDSTITGTTHHFGSVQALTREVGNARVWGGLHWRFATEDGTRIGRDVGRAVLAASCLR